MNEKFDSYLKSMKNLESFIKTQMKLQILSQKDKIINWWKKLILIKR